MKEPAAEGQSSQPAEVTVMVARPTIGATAVGRSVGRLAGVRVGLGSLFTVGMLLAVLTIPLSLGVFCWQLLPFVARRYRITDRRIMIETGITALPIDSIGLDRFDAIGVEELPGQAWLRSGDVVFLREGREVFRLPGVSRPEVFRHACLEIETTLASVQAVLDRSTA